MVVNQYTLHPLPTDSLYFQIDFMQCCFDNFIFEVTGHGSRNGRGTFDSKDLPDTIGFAIIERNQTNQRVGKNI